MATTETSPEAGTGTEEEALQEQHSSEESSRSTTKVTRSASEAGTSVDGETPVSPAEVVHKTSSSHLTWTAAECARNVDGGTLCKGIYVTPTDTTLRERETVITVNDQLDFTEIDRSTDGSFTMTFWTQSDMDTFLHNMDQFESDSFDDSVDGSEVGGGGDFASSVTCRRLPVASLELSPETMRLAPAALQQLRWTEKKLEDWDEQQGSLFQGFFERFGSHVTVGAVELGGVQVATATSEGSGVNSQEDMEMLVNRCSEAAFRASFSSGRGNGTPRMGTTFRASEVMSNVRTDLPEDLLHSTDCTIFRIGGPSEVDNNVWMHELKRDPSLWRVVARSSESLPVWELLKNHADAFQNFVHLTKAMQQDWSRLTADPTQRNSDLALWHQMFAAVNEKNCLNCLEALQRMKKEHYNTDEDWCHMVLSDPKVQTTVIAIADLIKISGRRLDKPKLLFALETILPWEHISEGQFPSLQTIKNVVQRHSAAKEVQPLAVPNLQSLSACLRQKLTTMWEDGESIPRLVRSLELYLEKMEQNFEYLLLVCVFRRCGFNLTTQRFTRGEICCETDIRSLAYKIDQAVDKVGTMKSEKEKQIFLFNMADEEDTQMLHFLFANMPGEVNPELLAAWKGSPTPKDFKQCLHDMTTEGLQRLVASVKIALSALPAPDSSSSHEESNSNQIQQLSIDELNPDVRRLLDILGLTRYFRQKLTYEEVTTLTADLMEDQVGNKPQKTSEVPFYFIKGVICLNSQTRENTPFDVTDQTPIWRKPLQSLHAMVMSQLEKFEEPDHISGVHPLDLIYLILLCADDFLRQELLDKMSLNQYAVPILLPSPAERMQPVVLPWGLKAISRIFKENGKLQQKTMVDAQMPLVSCLSFGDEKALKLKLINKLMNPDQDTFWHEGLEGADHDQLVSHGMVEAAWYLPPGPTDCFEKAMAFINLRGSDMGSLHVRTQLVRFSSIICIFTEKIDDELSSFLKENKANLHKIVLVVQPPPEGKAQFVSQDCAKLEKSHHPLKGSVIVNPAVDRKFSRTLKELKDVLTRKLNSHPKLVSMADLLQDIVTNTDINSDEGLSATGCRHANTILQNIDHLYKEHERGGASPKEEVLPCSSHLEARQAIADIDKELCHHKRMSSTETPTEFEEKMQEQKWLLQQRQLEQLVALRSRSFTDFISHLCTLEPKDRKYFLQALRLGLNDKSTKIMQPIREEYNKERSRTDGQGNKKAIQKKLADLSRKLVSQSFGMEHFFREMAVWYENLDALNKRVKDKPLQAELSKLSQAMASVLTERIALELIDGDSTHVPDIWIKAVLEALENRLPMKVFKVSVLGTQSCGKSTMLNTMFGLNFPVSAGRCTRGAYMQLVKMDSSLKKMLGCESLLVIDSEGLMSSELTDSDIRDRELATFVIGLSDLTLVIFKQEGVEMIGVLPIAVLAFMRMNLTGEKKACHFVRQNISAVEAESVNQIAIDVFIKGLDEQTAKAAEYCKLEDLTQSMCFTDVLQYNKNTDNTYVPGLWEGTPPMAKPNKNYSTEIWNLKRKVLKQLHDMKHSGKKSSTLPHFSTWLNDLWDGIKYENFIFSFRNVLAVDAYRNLTLVLDNQKRTLRNQIKTIIHERTHNVGNQHILTEQDLNKLVEMETGPVKGDIEAKTSHLRDSFVHFFQCTEYNCIDKEHHCHVNKIDIDNKHMISDNAKAFMDDIDHLEKELEADLNRDFNNIKTRKLTQITIRNLDSNMEARILQRVKDAIGNLKTKKKLGLEEKLQNFNELWQEETRHVQKAIQDSTTELPNIASTVHQCILDIMKTTHEVNTFRKREGKHPITMETPKHFQVSSKHIKPVSGADVRRYTVGRWTFHQKKNPFKSTRSSLENTQLETNSLLEKARKRFAWKEDGEMFKKAAAYELFQEVIYNVFTVKEVSQKYRVELIQHIKAEAIHAFTSLHKQYQQRSSPQAMLDETRAHYERRFLMELDQGDLAVNFSHKVLKEIVLDNLNDVQQTCRKEDLVDHLIQNNRRFRNAQTLHASVLVDLYREKNFNQFKEFLGDFNSTMKRIIKHESLDFFKENQVLQLLGKRKLEEIIGILSDNLTQTAEKTAEGSDYITTFFRNINGLKLPPTQAYKDISVEGKFAEIALEQLIGPVKKELLGTFDKWDFNHQLERRGMNEFLFTEFVGCGERCPFCKAPCDIHRAVSSGDHMTQFHRPSGVGSTHWSEDSAEHLRNKLVTEDCTYNISSDRSFRHNHGWKPYKMYREVYPNWSIQGNPDPNVEKYWKWFFATYNKQLAEHHEYLPADIPESWHRIREEDLLKDIETKYNVTINRDTLTID